MENAEVLRQEDLSITQVEQIAPILRLKASVATSRLREYKDFKEDIEAGKNSSFGFYKVGGYGRASVVFDGHSESRTLEKTYDGEDGKTHSEKGTVVSKRPIGLRILRPGMWAARKTVASSVAFEKDGKPTIEINEAVEGFTGLVDWVMKTP